MLLNLKKLFTLIVIPFLSVGIVVYFSYHAVRGERGLTAYTQIKERLDETRLIESNLADERADLEKKVKNLNTKSLDLDLLSERAHTVINYAAPDEVIINDFDTDLLKTSEGTDYKM